MDRLAALTTIMPLYPAASRDDSVAEGDAVDVTTLADNLLVLLDSAAGSGTTPTLNLAIQHREDAADTWAAVPAEALYDPATGQAATFAAVTDAAASVQTLALRRARLKAQVRAVLTIGGTTPAFVCAAYLVGLPKYSPDW